MLTPDRELFPDLLGGIGAEGGDLLALDSLPLMKDVLGEPVLGEGAHDQGGFAAMAMDGGVESGKIADGMGEPVRANQHRHCPIEKIMNAALNKAGEEALREFAKLLWFCEGRKRCAHIFLRRPPETRQAFLGEAIEGGYAGLPGDLAKVGEILSKSALGRLDRGVEAGRDIVLGWRFGNGNANRSQSHPKIFRLRRLGDGKEQPERFEASRVLQRKAQGLVTCLRDGIDQLCLVGLAGEKQANDVRQILSISAEI
jgi:hypothetical protein